MTKPTNKTEQPNPLVQVGAGAAEDFETGQPEKFIPTGIPGLDRLILGIVAGELTLIAAPPSNGKTALAMQILQDTAQNIGPAAILSLEMGRRALRNRLISSITGIPMDILRSRAWPSPKHKAAAVEAASYLESIPLMVDDRGGMDGDRVYEAIMSWKKQGIVLGAVDYIQQMSGANDSRVTQVGDAIRAVKAATKDADLPIIAVSAMNRAGASDNRPPKLSDLRDSGDLEYVADTILMFHFPGGPDDRNDDVRDCDIHVMKQRNGPTGVVSVQFNRPQTRFVEIK